MGAYIGVFYATPVYLMTTFQAYIIARELILSLHYRTLIIYDNRSTGENILKYIIVLWFY